MMGLFSLFGLLACAGRRRAWSPGKLVDVDLEGIARLAVPKDLKYRAASPDWSDDRVVFELSRVNDTHLSGQTSNAEYVSLTLIAPDLPEDRFHKQSQAQRLALRLVRKLGEAARPDGGYRQLAPVTVFRFVQPVVAGPAEDGGGHGAGRSGGRIGSGSCGPRVGACSADTLSEFVERPCGGAAVG